MTLHGARKRATFILRSSDATHVPPTEHALRQRIPEMIQSPDPGSQRDMGLIAGDTLTGVESPPPCPRLRRAHRAGVVALSLLAAVHPDDATSGPVRAPATQAHSALFSGYQPDKKIESCGLSCSIGAQQTDNFSPPDRQAHVIDNFPASVGFA